MIAEDMIAIVLFVTANVELLFVEAELILRVQFLVVTLLFLFDQACSSSI